METLESDIAQHCDSSTQLDNEVIHVTFKTRLDNSYLIITLNSVACELLNIRSMFKSVKMMVLKKKIQLTQPLQTFTGIYWQSLVVELTATS